MNFIETKLDGAYVIDLEPIKDERGFFARAWCKREFEEQGLVTNFVQANISFNEKAGTLRGMHYQIAPHEEIKLIRCTRGAIYDVIIDLRPGSKTFKKWISVELSAENYRMVYIPKGFAHGFQTLCDASEMYYLHSEYYAPNASAGVRWDDPEFGIDWPEIEQRVISNKDTNWPPYHATEC